MRTPTEQDFIGKVWQKISDMEVDEYQIAHVHARESKNKKQQVCYTISVLIGFIAVYLISTILFASPVIGLTLLLLFFFAVYSVDGLHCNYPLRGESIGFYRNQKPRKEI